MTNEFQYFPHGTLDYLFSTLGIFFYDIYVYAICSLFYQLAWLLHVIFESFYIHLLLDTSFENIISSLQFVLSILMISFHKKLFISMRFSCLFSMVCHVCVLFVKSFFSLTHSISVIIGLPTYHNVRHVSGLLALQRCSTFPMSQCGSNQAKPFKIKRCHFCSSHPLLSAQLLFEDLLIIINIVKLWEQWRQGEYEKSVTLLSALQISSCRED